jgi:hypothetical protein
MGCFQDQGESARVQRVRLSDFVIVTMDQHPA